MAAGGTQQQGGDLLAGAEAEGASGLPGLLRSFATKLAEEVAPATALMKEGQVGGRAGG